MLHLFPQRLVPPAGQAAVVFMARALGFAWACLPSGGRGIAKRSAWCGGGKTHRPCLVPWASGAICGRIREEIFVAKEAACPVGRGVGLRKRGHNSSSEALFACLAIVLAPLCDALSLRRGQRILRALCHGGERSESRHCIRDLMVYNQCIFVLYGKLAMVTDIKTVCGVHRATLRGWQRYLGCFTLVSRLKQLLIASWLCP